MLMNALRMSHACAWANFTLLKEYQLAHVAAMLSDNF